MSIIFDPADRGQNAGAQNNAARGWGAGGAGRGEYPRLSAQRRGAEPRLRHAGVRCILGRSARCARRPHLALRREHPEEFQKFVQLSSQGAVIFALYAPIRRLPCRCSRAYRSSSTPPQVV